MLRGKWNGQQTQDKLYKKYQQNGKVGGLGGRLDASIKHTPTDQQYHANQAGQTEYTASRHRQDLLCTGRHHEMIRPVRGQQSHQVTKKQGDDANMEQVTTQSHILFA